jgi:hypothetical protein
VQAPAFCAQDNRPKCRKTLSADYVLGMVTFVGFRDLFLTFYVQISKITIFLIDRQRDLSIYECVRILLK